MAELSSSEGRAMSGEFEPTRAESTTGPEDGSDADAAEPPYRLRTALIDGMTFKGKPVVYTDVKGWAIFEGDIRLGRIDELEASTDRVRAARRAHASESDVASDVNLRWPGGVIPYVIDAALPDQGRVHDAIAHWHSRTPIRLVTRTSEVDYVRFVVGEGCRSSVGRVGGEQWIELSDGCDRGSTIHEIFHAVGAWHEQSREDRDSFVRIQWENIEPGKEHNFSQHIDDSDDVGPYDYSSIMHYSRGAFSRNDRDTIVPLQDGAQIGLRERLSDGDVEAVKAMYPGLAWPKKDDVKDGLKDEITKDEDPKDGLKDNTKDETKDDPKWDVAYKEEPKEEYRDPPVILKDSDRNSRDAEPGRGPRARPGVPSALPFVIAGGTGSAGPGRQPAGAGTVGLLPQLHLVLAAFAELNHRGAVDDKTLAAWRLTTRAYLKLLGRR